MLEQQFIQFQSTIEQDYVPSIPVCDEIQTSFYHAFTDADDNGEYLIDLLTPNGDLVHTDIADVKSIPIEITDDSNDYKKAIYCKLNSLSGILAPADCFRLRLREAIGDVKDYQGIPDFNVAPEDAPFAGRTLLDVTLKAGKYKLTTDSIIIEEFDTKREHYAFPTIFALKVVAAGETVSTSQYVNNGICPNMEVEFVLASAGHVQIILTEFVAYNGYATISADGVITITHSEENIIGYSNMLQYVCNNNEHLSGLSYFCNDPQFGIPFSTYRVSSGLRPKYAKGVENIALPIRISKPQYKQTDKIYENRNGEQIVLYATINKEYEGETDYIPDEWHEKIVTALSCDEVYINDERVTKSDSYEIDQDNYTYSDCGIRLTRATFKVKTNVTQRNSNC